MTKEAALKGFLVAVLLMVASVAHADKVCAVYGGANGAWFDDRANPGDFELGGNGVASLSPHVSAVASAYYGTGNSYLRATGGFRVTATDVENEDFSIGLGLQYQLSSKVSVRPQEFVADCSAGWKPWPSLPRWSLNGRGSYGLDSNQAALEIGVRYLLGEF